MANDPTFETASQADRVTLVKADLGIKRICPSCGARFYDLQKRPIECPKCAFSFEPEALYKQRRPRQPEPQPVAAPVARDDDEENEDEEESEDVELEEADEVVEEPVLVVSDDDEAEPAEEAAEEDAGMSVVEPDAEVADIEDLDDDVVDDDEEDDSLLEAVEEDEDDVSGIIDADIGKDEP
jgi:uncharacterized protein (TIGR02300 family)